MPFSFPIELGISNLMFVVSPAIRLGLLSCPLFVLFFIPSHFLFRDENPLRASINIKASDMTLLNIKSFVSVSYRAKPMGQLSPIGYDL